MSPALSRHVLFIRDDFSSTKTPHRAASPLHPHCRCQSQTSDVGILPFRYGAPLRPISVTAEIQQHIIIPPVVQCFSLRRLDQMRILQAKYECHNINMKTYIRESFIFKGESTKNYCLDVHYSLKVAVD